MISTIRVFLSSIAAVATFYFVFLLPFSLLLPHDRLWWVRFLGSLICAVAATRYVWRHSASISQGFASSVMLGALVTGAIGFSAGFFGPMIVAPDANQGPLLGIFITGPLGVVAGAVGGCIYWLTRGRRSPRSTDEGTGAV
jgi:hypothetical protein